MGLVKVLHEFGHGLSCKFGGECHEIGFMLLVFTPCLYCNVSDSWMLPNKWKRVWIGATGIYVEMFLASIATFIWWFTEEGTAINDLSLNMMFLNAVSTVLVNEIRCCVLMVIVLMDALEIPNLAKEHRIEACLSESTWDWNYRNPFLPTRGRFFSGAFTVASVIYRWVVVFSICWLSSKFWNPTVSRQLVEW